MNLHFAGLEILESESENVNKNIWTVDLIGRIYYFSLAKNGG
jgi:hypothetical protein